MTSVLSFLFLSIRGLDVTSAVKYQSSNTLTSQGSVVSELIKSVSTHQLVDLFKYLNEDGVNKSPIHATSTLAKTPTGHRLGFR